VLEARSAELETPWEAPEMPWAEPHDKEATPRTARFVRVVARSDKGPGPFVRGRTQFVAERATEQMPLVKLYATRTAGGRG
jgi:hypothetical protein